LCGSTGPSALLALLRHGCRVALAEGPRGEG
jgi:hypothetical protein